MLEMFVKFNIQHVVMSQYENSKIVQIFHMR